VLLFRSKGKLIPCISNREKNPSNIFFKKLTNTTVCPRIKASLKAAMISIYAVLVSADSEANQGDRFMSHSFLQCFYICVCLKGHRPE